jgi:hypothetical protein
MERPVKRTRFEEPAAMEIDTRYKRKAEVLEEPIQLTPMEVDEPFVFYPIPQLIRADAMDN